MDSNYVRVEVTTGDLPPKHGQTHRAGSIDEFVFYVLICSMYTNSSMEPVHVLAVDLLVLFTI